MSRTATLDQLLDDIKAQADVLGADVRHSDTRITRILNQSIQRFREKLTIHGVRSYLTYSTGTLTAGVESPFSFRTIDVSSITLLVRPYGLDLTVNGEVRTLNHVPFEARNDYGAGRNTGIPDAWSQFNRNTLIVLPAPDAAYAYTLWYIPRLADLALVSDTFDGVAGWEDWMVWDVVCRLLVRDQTSQAYQMAAQERQLCWSDIMSTAPRVNRGGPRALGRDTFGEKRSNRERDRLPPP